MPIADDIAVAAGGDIRYTGSGANYTGIELCRFLQSLAASLTYAGDDVLSIDFTTPADRKGTDNYIELLPPYNIDDTLAQHLFDASIVQNGGDDIYDAIECYAPQGTYIEIIRNGEVITPNFWTTGINPNVNKGVSSRFLVKVRSGGVDIDGRKLLGITRELGYKEGEFPINGTSRGNNTLALKPAIDLNNQTPEATIAAWTGITNVEGYALLDVDNDGTPEPYFSTWSKTIHAINNLYEFYRYLRRRGTTATLYGLNGVLFRGVTHEVVVDTPTGTFNDFEPVSWTGGTGQMLAINSPTAGTKLWMQLLTGSAPTDNQTITGGTSGATCDVNGTVTERSLGDVVSTGTALIGAYGFGVAVSELSKDDKLTDLDGAQNIPPNNVIFSLTDLIVGDSTILVGPLNPAYVAGVSKLIDEVIDTSQLSLSGSHTAGQATVNVAAIPGDTPKAGTLKIYTSPNIYATVTYTNWSGNQFTGCSGVPTAADGTNAWIAYIYKIATATVESVSVVFSGARDLYIRVRDGEATPEKDFITTSAFGATNNSVTVIHTLDV